MDPKLTLILNYLQEKRGFDFTGYRSSMVERRIRKRLTAKRCLSLSEYFEYVKSDDHELDSLLEVLTIKMSRFFRDTLTFEYMAHMLLPPIISEKVRLGDHSLRIWSAGCSTGEEPYSMAILINELLKKEDFKLNTYICATDIDQEAIRRAQKAVYSFDRLKDVKYGLIKEYFRPENNSFALIPKIQKTVSFSLYDLLDKRSYTPPESVYGNFDIALCRNVLI